MRILVQSLVLALSTLGTFAHAQDFPTKPITIVNPLTAGTGVDVMTRLYADAVARDTGQRILVENKTGSGGIAAALAVKDARPDGYTLLVAHVGTQSTLPAMQTLPFDALKDFEPITELFYFPTYLVVPAASPAKTAADLIALAKTKPGGVRLASQGVGSGTHILGAIWQDLAKAPIEHVPYRGSGQILPDLLAGRVDMSFISYLTIRELVKDGKLRILAVASPRRWTTPTPSSSSGCSRTFAATGRPLWNSNTSPRNIEKREKLIDTLLKEPAVQKKLGDAWKAKMLAAKPLTFKHADLTGNRLFLYVVPGDKQPKVVPVPPTLNFFVKPVPPTPPVPPKPPAPPQVDKFEKLIGELIAAKKSDGAILEAITLATLSRLPTDSEKELTLAAVASAKDRKAVWVGVAKCWPARRKWIATNSSWSGGSNSRQVVPKPPAKP